MSLPLPTPNEAAPEAGRFGFAEALEALRRELAPRELLEVIIARRILGMRTLFVGRLVVTDPGDLPGWLAAAREFYEAGFLGEAALAHFIEEALLVTLPEFYDDPEVRHLQDEIDALVVARYNAPDRRQRRAVAAQQAEVMARWCGVREVVKLRVMRRLGEERYADLIESDPSRWWALVLAGASEWTSRGPWNGAEPIPFEFDADDEPAGVGRDAAPVHERDLAQCPRAPGRGAGRAAGRRDGRRAAAPDPGVGLVGSGSRGAGGLSPAGRVRGVRADAKRG